MNMGRKRSADSETSSQAGNNGAHPAPANKTEAVGLAMAAGVSSPTEIAVYVKDQYGLTITPAHVSTIKGNLKRARRKKKPGRKSGRKAASAGASAPRSTPQAPAGEAGLTTKDLTSLIEMARRAGGFDVLHEYVEVLRR
jgi:hypothetical protein